MPGVYLLADWPVSDVAVPDLTLTFRDSGLALHKADGEPVWASAWSDIDELSAVERSVLPDGRDGVVILVVDTTKVVGYTIGALADYLAMLTLSVAQSPDHCDPLPSILDLMSSSCSARELPTAITAGDLAFLKALYYKNTGLGPSLSRSTIEDNMAQQFKAH